VLRVGPSQLIDIFNYQPNKLLFFCLDVHFGGGNWGFSPWWAGAEVDGA
jgi:hypothetical protein